ncbi:hypothetical protein [Polaribacter sp. AHE13PA]|jgi:hypothetical protein|uniref:hypothetical protein n=1 Tax=Polaribacter sp. AHE13PA TaxID=2745562 RepID=UPI001C500E5A|nr:hypothetical protein [Polaribacter sp. AHE13PA]QXP66560.1 hypothetical protein H0I28_15560 [Polaribacter sp. AHE13PA]
MIFLQVPPPMGPPPPPGLPIDSGVIILLSIAVIYGILLIRAKSSKDHLKSSSIYNLKKNNRLDKSYFFKGIAILTKKYDFKNVFVILLFSKVKRKVVFTIQDNN